MKYLIVCSVFLGGCAVNPSDIFGTGGTGSSSSSGNDKGSTTNSTVSTSATSSSSGQCQPKNCIDLALELNINNQMPVPKACGILNDGCGNHIDCGGCNNGQGCGIGEPDSPNTFKAAPANLCEGGCRSFSEMCGTATQDKSEWHCSGSSSNSPVTMLNCTLFENNPSTNTFIWCCG